MALKQNEFNYIVQLVRDRAGIILEPGKEYLVESRLLPVVREVGSASLSELITGLRARPNSSIYQKVIEAMTTNETSFFRDLHPFEALRTVVVPDLISKRGEERTLHLWCAATSSGQEPYTVMMLLREHFPELRNWTLRFVASDISGEMLDRARTGHYSQLEVSRGMPLSLLSKYFQRQGREWQIIEDIRRQIEFRQVNLADAWPLLPRMDIIFLRNVLIYFDLKMKKTIFGKVRRLLRPDGYLFLGAAETTLNLDDGFERIQVDKAGCYRVRAH